MYLQLRLIPNCTISFHLKLRLLGHINKPKPVLLFKPIDSQCSKYAPFKSSKTIRNTSHIDRVKDLYFGS